MNSVPILNEAKKEYTNKLQQILAPRLYEGFKSIFEDILRVLSDEMIENNYQSSSAVKVFQKSLKEIPTWNNDMIRGEYSRIEKISKCDYLEDLLEAVFVSNVKILTSIQLNNTKSLKNINVPQPHTFMHKCYIECSKELYKNPYIFDTRSFTPKERHSNLRESLSLINQSIENAIRELLPIREILKQGILQNKPDFDNNNEEDQEKTNESFDSDDKSEYNQLENDEELMNQNKINEDNQHDIIEIPGVMNNFENNENINEEENNEEEDNEEDDNEEDDNEDDNNEEDENEEINLNNVENNEIILNDNSSSQNIETKIIKLDSNEDLNKESIINPINNSFNENINDEYKEINITSNPIVKKINTIEKIEKKPEITDLIKPYNKSININKNLQKVNRKKLIKNKLISGSNNNSFYQKKYDENLANYNYTSESYLDEDEHNSISKNQLNINISSDDDEESSVVELV